MPRRILLQLFFRAVGAESIRNQDLEFRLGWKPLAQQRGKKWFNVCLFVPARGDYGNAMQVST
jgi:hypothetical protein